MTHTRRFAWNTFLSLLTNLALRAAGVLAFIAIARLENVRDAGTFSLALGYLAILTTLFSGLDDILVRESARTPEQTWTILITYGTIRFTLTIVAWLVLVLMLGVLSPYSASDLTVIAILASSILVDAFSALGQSVSSARGHFGWQLAAIAVGSVIKIGGALFALEQHSFLGVALVWPLGSIFTATIMIAALIRDFRHTRLLGLFHFNRNLAHSLLRLFPSFSTVSILAGLEYQLDVILLSIMLTNEAVAEYSAAVTIMMIVQMISQAFRIVLYPAMVRSLNSWPIAPRRLVQRSILLMAGLSFVSATVVTLIATHLVNLVYGIGFLATGPILQVLIWNVVFMFLDVPMVRFMMATDGQTAIWHILALGVVVNIAANMMMIPHLGVIGAAYARLCSSGLFCLLIGWQVVQRLDLGSIERS